MKPNFLNTFSIAAILGQHFRDQFLEACVARQDRQMAHQDRPDALALIGIDHDEGDFGLAWLDDDIIGRHPR